MELTLKVHRYDPTTDGKGQLQSYNLEIDEKASVLDALMQVREDQDSTLAFRGTCRTGFCGDCTMRISRRNRIACYTTVSEALRDGEITVEPIRLIGVAKDMMFNVKSMVYDKYAAVEPWVEPAEPLPEREHMVSNEVIKDLRKVMSCTMCWLCDEGCSTMVVDKKFMGPAALTKGYRAVSDPRDSRTDERLRNLGDVHGLWDCCHCFEASEHCPKGIEPTERIFALRDMAIKKNLGSPSVPTVRNHYRSFAASVKAHGWLDEARLAIETEGVTNIAGQLKQLPLGIKALIRGKLPKPYFFHKKRKGADRVKRIFEKWEEKK
jgi:succinate dehydrogenase / fumarate reductase iron-sulfur subunit